MNTVRQTASAAVCRSPLYSKAWTLSDTPVYQGMNTVRQTASGTAAVCRSRLYSKAWTLSDTAVYQGMNTARQTAQQGADIVRHSCLSRHEYSETDPFNVVSTRSAKRGHSRTHRFKSGCNYTISTCVLKHEYRQTDRFRRTIIIMYIYHALINALSVHIIHINLNTISYTHVVDSPTKTVYIRYYMETHTHTHTHTHTMTVAETGY